jgi:hypothetical protein
MSRSNIVIEKKERQRYFGFVFLPYQKENHQLSYYSSNNSDGSILKLNEEDPAKAILCFLKAKDEIYIHTIRDGTYGRT